MGLKTNNPGIFRQFRAHIEADPETEIFEPSSEWELLRYRREDWVEGNFMGTHSYGIVYRNKRDQQHYTGCAEQDYKYWRDS